MQNKCILWSVTKFQLIIGMCTEEIDCSIVKWWRNEAYTQKLLNSKVFHSVQCQVVPESISEHLILEKFLGGMKENIQSPTNFYTAIGGKGSWREGNLFWHAIPTSFYIYSVLVITRLAWFYCASCRHECKLCLRDTHWNTCITHDAPLPYSAWLWQT